ncbi:MAG: hypothetical protein ACPGQS_01160 [Bradymonadia bacterium]
MKITNQITRTVIGAVISLLLVITSGYAEEKGHSNIEYSVTAYGIFNLATNGTAHEGKVYSSDDGDYAGWSGQGLGAGIGFAAMWQGYVGIDVQMLYNTHALSGSFNDPRGGQLDFNYKLAQFDLPIMLKAAYPNRYLTPTIAMGSVLRKDFSDVDNLSLTGGEADVRVGQGFSTEHWLTRFGAGLEKTLPLEGHDLRLSLNIMINYDGHIADGFEADETGEICRDQPNGNSTEVVCTFVPELGTIWRTDVILGLGYHF